MKSPVVILSALVAIVFVGCGKEEPMVPPSTPETNGQSSVVTPEPVEKGKEPVVPAASTTNLEPVKVSSTEPGPTPDPTDAATNTQVAAELKTGLAQPEPVVKPVDPPDGGTTTTPPGVMDAVALKKAEERRTEFRRVREAVDKLQDTHQDMLNTAEFTADPRLKEIGTQATRNLEKLSTVVILDGDLHGMLEQAASQLQRRDDVGAMETLARLTADDTFSDMGKVIAEVENSVGAMAIRRNFSGLTQKEDIALLETAVFYGDHATALKAAQKVTAAGGLNANQQSLLKSITAQMQAR